LFVTAVGLVRKALREDKVWHEETREAFEARNTRKGGWTDMLAAWQVTDFPTRRVGGGEVRDQTAADLE
jgi:lysophospholipase L1-like esterase